MKIDTKPTTADTTQELNPEILEQQQPQNQKHEEEKKVENNDHEETRNSVDSYGKSSPKRPKEP